MIKESIGVIMAGGKGTRLWPVSRENYPKQFLKIFGTESLFQKTVKRIKGIFSNLLVNTRDIYKFLVEKQLKEVNFKKVNLILEPIGKGTAGVVFLTCKYLLQKGFKEKDVVSFFPSDHYIYPEEKYIKYIKQLIDYVYDVDKIALLGIRPSFPHTGYGYIEITKKSLGSNIYIVKSFKEKPDCATAKKYLKKGNYFWNTGIFVGKIGKFLEEIYKYNIEFQEFEDYTYEKLIENYTNLPGKQFDRCVLEKTKDVICMGIDIYWEDLGSWDSIYRVNKKDYNGNVFLSDRHSGNGLVGENSKNNLIYTKGNKKIVVLNGIKDLVIVDTLDVLYIGKRGESQKIKEIVKRIGKC